MEEIPKPDKLGNKNTNVKYCLISKLLADLTSCFVVDIYVFDITGHQRKVHHRGKIMLNLSLTDFRALLHVMFVIIAIVSFSNRRVSIFHWPPELWQKL